MAFPTNPSPGDSYTDEYGTVWVYAGAVNGWYRQTVTTPNDTSYTAAISGPAGSNTQVQFNDNGELAGDSGLTYNKTTDALSGGAFIPTGSTVPSNGLYRPSANNVALSTNGVQRINIEADGDINIDSGGVFYDATNNRLAIGTTSPNYTLDVNAAGTTISSSFTSDQSEQYIALKDSGTTLGHVRLGSTSGAMLFNAGNAERARIDSSGRLGIGTTIPGERLSLGEGNALGWNDSSGNNAARIYATSGDELRFERGSTNSRSMTIDSSGRLLVGTSSDSGGALLQVNGNRIRVATAKTPASASDTGTTGEICWDASYIYVCTATNTWKRAALSTW